MKINNNITNLGKLFKYNQKIIFANKFIYFLLAAIGFFILMTGISLFNDSIFDESNLFVIILITGILLIFYPACFGIQNDQDSKIIEILFGIPNYRYKVWLIRLVMIYFIISIILLAIICTSQYLLIDINILEFLCYIMFPIILIGNLAFFISSITRSGNGTAIILIILFFILFIFQYSLKESKWNIFLNPYLTNSNINPIIWGKILLQNKIFINSLALISLIWGLLNLQKREKFI